MTQSSPVESVEAAPSTQGSIGISQYSGREDLTCVTIPDGVRHIDDFAFYGCDNLTEVNLPSSLTEIGEAAFASCGKLTEIRIPSGVKAIGRCAFADCRSLRAVTLPEQFSDIAPDIFSGCHSLADIVTGPAYTQTDGFIVLASDRKIVLAVPTAVKNGIISLPAGSKSIAQGALSLCSQATKVSLPNSIAEVDGASFSGLPLLTEIEVQGGSPYRFGGGSLWDADTLVIHLTATEETSAEVEIPDCHAIIGPHSFASCASLKNIHIHSANQCRIEIGESAFEGCTGLDSITFPPDSATNIGIRSFRRCSNLKTLINCTAESIGDMAFEGCTCLNEAPLSDSTESIGADAFAECTSLTSVSIPMAMKKVPDGAFANCSNLLSVDFHDDIYSIGNQAFIGCTKLTSVDMPVNIKSIGCGAFACSGLVSVAIPKFVEHIGNFAFGICRSLEAATMPSEFFSKTDEIFAICPKLQMMGTNNAAK